MSLTTDANINDRFLIPPGSSITNIKNTFNDFVTQIQNSSFINILKNSKLTDHFAGNPIPYAWNLDLGVTIDTSNPDTIVNFTGINQEIAQPIVDILKPIEQYLLPATEYLAIFDISPENDCEVGLSYGAGLVNLLGSGAVSGSDYNALHSTVYGGSSGITYFVFKTAEDFSEVTFYIKNLSLGSNAVTLHKLSLVEGTLNLMDSIESNLFLDHIRYDDTILKWTYTNDGITWLPFLEELTPSSTYIASYTPIHDQIPILSGVGGTQLAAGILPIGNGYLSPLVDLTIGGTGAIDLNTCTIAGVIYTTDGSVSIPNSPYDIFNGTAWWTGDLNGSGCQFAASIQGYLWSRTFNILTQWTPWNLTNNNAITENIIINGNMDVWRRGGVASPFLLPESTTAYTADRWRVSTTTHYASNVSIAKSVLQPVNGIYLVPGSRNAFSMYHPQLNADITLSTRTTIEQRIEDITRFVNTNVTFSFWATSDTNMTGTVYADIIPTGTPATIGFNCNTDMFSPQDVGTDSNYIYALNGATNHKIITRYNKTTGIEDTTSGGGFNCTLGISNPARLLVYGGFLYVTNLIYGNVAKYDATSGTVISTSFISEPGGADPEGICTDGAYIYTTHLAYKKILRWNLSTGSIINAGWTPTADIEGAAGICTNGTYLYAVCNSTNKVRRFRNTSGVEDTTTGGTFLCNTGMNKPSGISTDNTYLYVTNNNNIVTKYDIVTGTQITSPSFSCIVNLSTPTGISNSGTFLYVVNKSNNTVTRYDKSTGVFDNSGVSNPGISVHNYEQDVNFISGVWQEYSVSFSIGTPPGLFTDPLDYFAIGIIPNVSILNATPAYNFSFTQAQLEYGQTPTAFGARTISEEELLCQRYFQTSYTKNITPGTSGQQRSGSINWLNGLYGSTHCIIGNIQLVPRMRITPTVIFYSPANGTAGDIDKNTTNTPTALASPTIHCSDEAITAIDSATITSGEGSVSYQFHYIADSEL